MIDTTAKWTAAMRNGRFDQAWAISRAVMAASDPATRDDPSQPYHRRWVWDGMPPARRHVLVRCYHGLGDTIQFARYLPTLAACAASVTVEVQPELLPLLATMPMPVRLVPFDPASPQPGAECDIEIMELAFALGLPPDAVPLPYLPTPHAVARGGLVGLCPVAGDWDRDRCVPAALLEPFCRDHDCVWLVPSPCALPVRNPAGCGTDIMATAALIAATELVVTVDTMIAHLAGAMGKPTWLMLKDDPDWRWSLGRSSRWYPSARLYRQPTPGDWAPVVAGIAADLAATASAPPPAGLVQRDEAHA